MSEYKSASFRGSSSLVTGVFATVRPMPAECGRFFDPIMAASRGPKIGP